MPDLDKLSELVQRWNDGFRLTAQNIQPLDEAATRATKGLCVFVRDKTPLPSLATVFRDHGEKGAGRVHWLTHETNTHAMLLYDRIADRSGFVQYRKIF